MKNHSRKTSGYEDAFTLQSLYSKKNELEKLSAVVCAHLPIEYQSKILVVKYQNNQLLLNTSNQLLAYKLRFLLEQLKKDLQQQVEFNNLTVIKLKITSSVAQNNTASDAKPQPELLYSEKSAQLLADFSESLGSNKEDRALQQALKRLAQHIKEK